MDDLSTERLLFEDIQGKKIEADFDGGQVTSNAGVLLLREVERRLGLIGRIAKIIRDRRHPGYTRHSIREMLSQRVFQIACGYEDADDADTLRTDPAIKMACDQLPEDEALASQPTLSRLENAVTRTDLYRIAEALVDLFISSYRTPPVAILLDIDDTADTTHGHQQLALFNAYYDEFCYLPIHIYEGRSGKLITTILRPGRRPSGKEIVAILKRVVYEKLYSERGTMELLIKDHKTYLRSDRTSCHRFEANQFRLFLHSMAYVLKHALRRHHLRNTPWARAQFDTIRLQVLKIGARVRQLRTRVRIHLPTSYPWQTEWRTVFRSCRASP